MIYVCTAGVVWCERIYRLLFFVQRALSQPLRLCSCDDAALGWMLLPCRKSQEHLTCQFKLCKQQSCLHEQGLILMRAFVSQLNLELMLRCGWDYAGSGCSCIAHCCQGYSCVAQRRFMNSRPLKSSVAVCFDSGTSHELLLSF
jgi:hypothetical protein